MSPSPLLAGRNPVAKFGAAIVLTAGLLVTVDPVAPAIALAGELVTVPLFGLSPRRLLRQGWPVVLGAIGAAVVGWLFGTGPDPLFTGAGLGMRVLAIALPSVLVFATTDPTDLADALVQNLRLPARFALGALAATRLFPLLVEDWRTLLLARRARGVAAGRNPVARSRLLASALFGLLVSAIRRGTRLATAMDARGFGASETRTFARRQRLTVADAALVLAALALVLVALLVSVAAGTFQPAL